jgi:glutamyl/glutaminyl-tRNA synthetase
LMGITHVIRGEDHISNTPKQILFQQALGFAQPIYAHMPLILNQDKSKFSKRKNKASLMEYETAGYLPEAIINFLALLGWHPVDDKDVLTMEDLIKEFDVERMQKSGAVFNPEKLNWLNREHMKKYSDSELAKLAMPFAKAKYPQVDEAFLERVVAVERSRANTLTDFSELGAFFFAVPEYEATLLAWKETPLKEIKENLDRAHAELITLNDANFHKESLTASIASVTGERSRGTVLWPLRVALSGQKSSPDPIEIMEVLGKHESLARIQAAIDKLK